MVDAFLYDTCNVIRYVIHIGLHFEISSNVMKIDECVYLKNDHLPAKHGHEMRRFFALDDTDLHRSTAHFRVHLHGLQRRGALLVLRRLPTEPVVNDMIIPAVASVGVQNDVTWNTKSESLCKCTTKKNIPWKFD